MKPTCQLILASLFMISTSCATLNKSEIRNPDKTQFEPLQLKPDFDPYNLRIDIIRQTVEVAKTDSTKDTEEVDYHHVGFNLGNGIFYDLNDNLCIRITNLLNIGNEDNFVIKKLNRPERDKKAVLYSFINDSFFVSNPPGMKKHYKYHKFSKGDSSAFMYKNRLRYAVIRSDTSLIYRFGKRHMEIISKLNDNQYCSGKKRLRNTYSIEGSRVILDKDYIVEMTNDNRTIEIKSYGRRRIKTLYTLVKDSDCIYIYNKNYHGKKIEFHGCSILISRDNKLIKKYELVK